MKALLFYICACTHKRVHKLTGARVLSHRNEIRALEMSIIYRDTISGSRTVSDTDVGRLKPIICRSYLQEYCHLVQLKANVHR